MKKNKEIEYHFIDNLRNDLKILESIDESYYKINFDVKYDSHNIEEYNTYKQECEDFENALNVITERIEKALHKKELELLNIKQ
jgi:hypothetical protein